MIWLWTEPPVMPLDTMLVQNVLSTMLCFWISCYAKFLGSKETEFLQTAYVSLSFL
jgi:hypothetical protein